MHQVDLAVFRDLDSRLSEREVCPVHWNCELGSFVCSCIFCIIVYVDRIIRSLAVICLCDNTIQKHVIKTIEKGRKTLPKQQSRFEASNLDKSKIRQLAVLYTNLKIV